MLEISCAKARAALISPQELLTAGMAKVVTVHFAFSPDWDSLSKTAVFSDGWRTVDVLEADWVDGCAPIPPEVLQTAGRNVRVGVHGSDSTGVVLPTIWAELGRVRPAADPSGDPSTDPTAPVWRQLQGQIGDLDELTTAAKSTLVAAINEAARSGGGGGGSARLSVTQTETGAVITATDATGTTSATVSNGADGHTPVITASKSGKVTTIKADGAAIAEIHDGADGSPGGGSAETWELIASGEMSEAATLTVNKDSNGNAFALKSCTILVSGALSGGRGSYVRFAVTASGVTYFVETSLASENMNADAKFTFRQGDVPTLAMCSKPGTAWQSGTCTVQMALRESDNALAAAQGAVNSLRIGPWSGGAKLGAGCKYALWGVRA